jgi:hypothetical protein
MAIQPKATKSAAKSGTASVPAMKKADAFLNQAVIGSDGNEYRLPKGSPLFIDDRVSGSMIRKELANRAAYDALTPEEKASAGDYQPLQFTFTGTVYIPSTEPTGDIPL